MVSAIDWFHCMKINWNFWGNFLIFLMSHLYFSRLFPQLDYRLIFRATGWRGSNKTHQIKSHIHFARTWHFLVRSLSSLLFKSWEKSISYQQTTSLLIVKDLTTLKSLMIDTLCNATKNLQIGRYDWIYLDATIFELMVSTLRLKVVRYQLSTKAISPS